MPALSSVLGKKTKSNQTTHDITADHTHTGQHLAREGASTFSLLGNHFIASCGGMREGHDTAAQHAKLTEYVNLVALDHYPLSSPTK